MAACLKLAGTSVALILKPMRYAHENKWKGFPGGTVVKNPPANAGDTALSPGLGRSHMPQSN